MIPGRGTNIPQAAANHNNKQNANQIIKKYLRVCTENIQKILETQQSENCLMKTWAKDLKILLTEEDIQRSV